MTNTLEEHDTHQGAGAFNALGPDDGETVWFLASRMTLKATAESTGGQYGLIEAEMPRGSPRPSTSTTARTSRSTCWRDS